MAEQELFVYKELYCDKLSGISLARVKQWMDRINTECRFDTDAVRGVFLVRDVVLDFRKPEESIVVLEYNGEEREILLRDLGV